MNSSKRVPLRRADIILPNATNKYKVLQQQAVLPVPISTEKENAIRRSSRKRVAF